MKLDPKTYRIVWEAHAWAGALASVLLVTMFVLGAFTLFHDELAPWQEPLLRKPGATSEETMLATAQQELERRVAEGAPRRIDIDLPSEHAPLLRFAWKDASGAEHAEWIDPTTGKRTPERSDLGHFLFLMHFLYPLPGGMLVAGLIALLLLLVVGSGFALQLGRFARELARFRPQQALRTVWGELHKVLGSIGLPFQAMVAWTAAIVCLNATVLQPIVVHTAFDGSLSAGLESIGYPRGPPPAKEPGAAPQLAVILQKAREALPGADHYRLNVHNAGDRAGYVDVRGHAGDGLYEFTTVKVSAAGELLHVRQAGGPGVTSRLIEGAYVLHSGTYGGFGLRMAYALLGLFGALCIVTGNLVWLERRARSPNRMDVALARLTAGGCGAAALSLASVFLANQLLPDALPNRISWEHGLFYAGWLGALVFGLVHPRPGESVQLLLGTGGGLMAAMPLLDACRNGRPVFAVTGSPYLFWTDVGLLAVGLLFLAGGWTVRRLSARSRPAATPSYETAADLG